MHKLIGKIIILFGGDKQYFISLEGKIHKGISVVCVNIKVIFIKHTLFLFGTRMTKNGVLTFYADSFRAGLISENRFEKAITHYFNLIS